MELIAILGMKSNIILAVDFTTKLDLKTRLIQCSRDLIEQQDPLIVRNHLACLQNVRKKDLDETMAYSDREITGNEPSLSEMLEVAQEIEVALTDVKKRPYEIEKSFQHDLRTFLSAGKPTKM
jgi:hypothetical protein